MSQVRLVNTTAAQLIAALPDGSVDLVLLDAPWLYGGAGVPGHGKAGDHYGGLPVRDILDTWNDCAPKCKPDAFAVVWLTWPLMAEFWRGLEFWLPDEWSWDFVTGGSWHKVRSKRGIGHHVLGDSEPWTLWRIGNPKTREQFSNAKATKVDGHSRKPAEVVREHVQAWSPPGGLVCDPYAGAHATFAKVCASEGRRYIGSEADPARFARAEKILHHWLEIS